MWQNRIGFYLLYDIILYQFKVIFLFLKSFLLVTLRLYRIPKKEMNWIFKAMVLPLVFLTLVTNIGSVHYQLIHYDNYSPAR